ncbi:MAG: tyrosine-type recombinase/integrase [Oscillospiraceae bacterium]|nr:tyrosine-type recombinase/integrase [Oscillospiraceae bacterium]
MGASWIETGTVFTGKSHGYFSMHYLNNKLKKFGLKIGLPSDFHTHSLRHTAASLLINSDVSVKNIAEQLGHARTTITENIYSHVFASSKVKTMQALEMKLTGVNADKE